MFVRLHKGLREPPGVASSANLSFEDKAPIRSMTAEDLAFHRTMMCLECAE